MSRATRITARGVRYEQAGAGVPAIVFVHDIFCDRTMWSLQLERFEGEHVVVALDQRGHGESSAFVEGLEIATLGADVVGLVGELGASSVLLVGHGLGARVVLEAARGLEGVLSALVLVDAGRIATGDPDEIVARAREEVSRRGIRSVQHSLIDAAFARSNNAALRERVLTSARAMPEPVVESLWYSVLAWDADRLDGALGAVRVPLLVLQSTYLSASRTRSAVQSHVTNPWFETVGRLAPAARIQVVGDNGHFPTVDSAGAVNRCLATFVADVTRRRFFR